MDFDPYEQWLKIPADHRPPGPHHLVGVNEQETDETAIYQAAMTRYELVRRYVLAPNAEVAEQAQRILGEIAQAMTSLLRKRTSQAPPPVEASAVDVDLVRQGLRKTSAAHVDEIPTRLLGQVVAIFSPLLDGDRDYVAVLRAAEPCSTILFTERACYHFTDRMARRVAYPDIARCVATKDRNTWQLSLQIRDQRTQRLLLAEFHQFTALKRLFQHVAEQNRNAGN